MKELKESKITADQQIEVCNNDLEMSEKVKWNLQWQEKQGRRENSLESSHILHLVDHYC